MPNAPYFAVYNVGDYTFASWKVIWAEQKEFCSAVVEAGTVPLIGRRSFVPDHKIFFVEFADKDEAFFLCGILNAPLVKEFIECHTISIQLGNIFKHMRVPSYDASNEEHTRLATACQKAHEASDDKHYLRLLSEMRELAERILA